ncbi:MAG TPA: hypothetical protein VFB78_07505 [Acidimicrobiales bacterium]|nr:hypothetical protein [Acidimicrobiales bacterium]
MAVIGRRRRPRWLWLLIMVTAIVLLVDLVVSTRSDEPSRRVASLGYLDQVRAQIEQSNRQGADVTDVRNKAGSLGRAGITRRLDRVARDTARTYAAARATDAPGDMVDARNLLLSTLWLRSRGTADMKDALDAALGKTAPEAAIKKMAEVGANLTAADRTYQGFIAAVNERAKVGREAVLPPSKWIDEPVTWQAAELEAFVRALRSSAELVPIHDTTVVLVTTEPASVRKEGDLMVLPLSRIKIQAIVANVGNEPLKDLKVEVTLVPGGDRTTARDFVSLAPGQRATVTLGGLVPLVDQPATLTVRIDAPGDDPTPADNQKVLQIVAKQ